MPKRKAAPRASGRGSGKARKGAASEDAAGASAGEAAGFDDLEDDVDALEAPEDANGVAQASLTASSSSAKPGKSKAKTSATASSSSSLSAGVRKGGKGGKVTGNGENLPDDMMTLEDVSDKVVPGLDLDVGDAASIRKLRDAGDSSRKKKPSSMDLTQFAALLKEVDKKPISKARHMYEKVLERFPLAEQHWINYAKRELKEKNYAEVERILKRTILTLSSVNLHLFYLRYVKERKLGASSSSSSAKEKEARKEVEEAFEFSLTQVGFAFEAGNIWRDYINFLKQQKCDSQFELQVKDKAVRGALQRAVQVPVEHMDQLWKDLEGEGSPPSEVQDEHMKAKAVFLERKARLQALNLPAAVGLPDIPYGDSRDAKKLNKWRALFEYEKGNPERVSDEAHKKRMRFAYNKALSIMLFFPEVWYESAQYELETNDNISARTILERSLEAIPDSQLLHFVLAEMLESQGLADASRKIYEKLEENDPCPIVFIQMLHFERRVGGTLAAREVFRRARQSPVCDSSIYTAAAMLEFHCNKDPQVARNVFELGMKRYPRDINFILDYVNFLEHLNKDNDLITLYERVLERLDSRECFPIWERFREFAYRFTDGGGNLRMLESIEKRFAAAYPGQNFLQNFPGIVHRYSFLGHSPDGAPDEAFLQRTRPLSFGPLGQRGGSSNGFSSSSAALYVGGGSGASFSVVSGDAAKTPAIVRKISSFLPESLGANVRPTSVEYVLGLIQDFRLPKKSLLARKKQRRVEIDEEATDIFKKRRQNL